MGSCVGPVEWAEDVSAWGHVLGQWNGLKTCMGSCVWPVEWTEDVYGVTLRCVWRVEWT